MHSANEVRTSSAAMTESSQQPSRCHSAIGNPILPQVRARWPIMTQTSTQRGIQENGSSLARSPNLQPSEIHKEQPYGEFSQPLDVAYILMIC